MEYLAKLNPALFIASTLLFFVVAIYVCYLYIIIKDNKKRKNPLLWDYYYYKNNRYLLDTCANLLLQKLAGGDYSEEEINKLISEYNALDLELGCPININMVEFEKRYLVETEPKKISFHKRYKFVEELE
ncbi:MAG: hypothetical protein ACP5OG_02380 [Candidatus Nanoarchaeia archaeon]